MKKTFVAVGVLTMINSFAQNALSDSLKTTNINDVVIVASRKPVKISEIPGTVWVMKKQEIEQQIKSGVPIKEMIAQFIPGMDVGAQGRTNFSQNLRGRTTLVMIDGVSLNSLRGVSRQLDAIDPFNIERIEVLSGASSIYGGNATGGIINIITTKAHQLGFSSETELGYKSGFRASDDHDYRVGQSLGYRTKKFNARVGAVYQQNGGFFNANGNQILTDITQTDLQYNRTIDVLASLGYAFNDNHSLSATLQYYDSRFNGERSLFLGENYSSILKANPSLFKMQDGFKSDQTIGTTRYMANLNYKGGNILGGQDLFIQLSHRGEELGFYPFPSPIKLGTRQTVANSSSAQNTYFTAAKVLLSKTWKNFNINYGVDADFENFDAQRKVYDMAKSLKSGGMDNETVFTLGRYPTFKSTTLAGYVQARYDILPNLQLSGGIRHQNMKVTIDDFVGTNEQIQLAYGQGKTATPISGGTSDYNITLGNASLLYKPTLNQQLWFSFSQGATLADPAKYYGVGSYKFNANTSNWDLVSSVNIKDQKLQGIVTTQYELGHRWTTNAFRTQFSAFLSQSDKAVELQFQNNNIFISVQDLKLRNLGIEGSTSYHLDNGFSAGLGLLFIKSDIYRNNQWERQDLFIASPSKMTSFIGYDKNKWSVRFQNIQNFNLKDQANDRINGYNLSDLMLGYELPFGKLQVGILNLFNLDYQTVWSVRAQKLYTPSLKLPELFNYQGRGRVFNFTYTLKF